MIYFEYKYPECLKSNLMANIKLIIQDQIKLIPPKFNDRQQTPNSLNR